MNIKLLSNKAVVPSKGSVGAAGYDLYTTESYELKPGERKAFKTDISLAIPEGFCGRIAPRSGLAYKNGIDILAGVIDYDYRGVIYVCMINNGNEDFEVKKGMKIAQLILEKCYRPKIVLTDKLDSTERGINGFGSTGI